MIYSHRTGQSTGRSQLLKPDFDNSGVGTLEYTLCVIPQLLKDNSVYLL